jgi:hypothetical protein
MSEWRCGPQKTPESSTVGVIATPPSPLSAASGGWLVPPCSSAWPGAAVGCRPSNTPSGAPRPAADCFDGRSPDSRVVACPAFPACRKPRARPVALGGRSPLTVAGAVTELAAFAYTTPYSLFTRPRVVWPGTIAPICAPEPIRDQGGKRQVVRCCRQTVCRDPALSLLQISPAERNVRAGWRGTRQRRGKRRARNALIFATGGRVAGCRGWQGGCFALDDPIRQQGQNPFGWTLWP